MRRATWENSIAFVLGIWLFFVPWAIPTNNLAASTEFLASWNFWIIGTLTTVSAGMALDELKPWEEWVNLALGMWLLISPWFIGFNHASGLMLNAAIGGLTIAVMATIALPIAHQQAQQQRQSHNL